MLLISKLLIALGGIGLITSALTSSYSYLTRNYKIKELLKKEHPDKAILKKGLPNKSEWLHKWQRYINENKNNDTLKPIDEWSLTDWPSVGAAANEVPEALAEKCEKQLNEEVINSKDTKYVLFVKYCTK